MEYETKHTLAGWLYGLHSVAGDNLSGALGLDCLRRVDQSEDASMLLALAIAVVVCAVLIGPALLHKKAEAHAVVPCDVGR